MVGNEKVPMVDAGNGGPGDRGGSLRGVVTSGIQYPCLKGGGVVVGDKEGSPLDISALEDDGEGVDKVHILTKEELDDIGKVEGVKFDQGRATPLFLVGRVETGQGQSKFAMEIDGGSDRSLCPLSLAKQLGLTIKRFSKDKDITGVGGTKIFCTHYTILKLWFKTKGGKSVKMTLLAYLVDTNIPVLLGNDVLGKLGAVINYENSTMTLGKSEIALCNSRVDLKRIMNERTDYVYVRASSEYVLPGHGTQIVDVELTSEVGGTVALIGLETESRFPLSTVWEERGEEGLQMIVVNKDKLPLTIRMGETIGFVACQSESVCLARLNEILEVIGEGKDETTYHTRGMEDRSRDVRVKGEGIKVRARGLRAKRTIVICLIGGG